MEWLKATGIAVVILVVGLGAFIGVNQFLSGSAEDETEPGVGSLIGHGARPFRSEAGVNALALTRQIRPSA